MQFEGIEINPAHNPATLDTLTWNPDNAVEQVKSNKSDFELIKEASMSGLNSGIGAEGVRNALASVNTQKLKLYPSSLVMRSGEVYLLVALPDGQRVFLSASMYGGKTAFPSIGKLPTELLTVYISPVNTETVVTYVKNFAPQFTPKPSATTARMGIGNRQTVTVWPGIFEAMREVGGPGEIVQNSAYRELAPMDFILAPPSGEATYLPGHGSLNIGHTGSSIEGLWLAGVVNAIEHNFTEPYGADLDHIPVKGTDDESISRAKRLIELGRHYTFFTLDASFLFNFDKADLKERYGAAIEVGAMMYDYIKSLKMGEPFDFEFSLDEGPAITTPEEQEFVLKSLDERGVKVTCIAPNVGFEKRVDYRLPDGLPALEARVKELSEIAAQYGTILDFHSGSDKASATYQTISRACDGKLKLKVSGKLQLILSEVLADVDREFFDFWWDWTLETARGEAGRGSDVASKYVGMVEKRKADEGQNFQRSPKDLFFTDFSFAMVGAKDESGRFLYRDRFYSLTPEVQSEYTRRVKDYVVKLAEDLNVRHK